METIIIFLKELLAELAEIRQVLTEKSLPGQVKGQEKELAELEWVLGYLGISLSSFRRHVKGRLLSPVFKAGKRELYSRREVMDLGRRGHYQAFRKLSPDAKN